MAARTAEREQFLADIITTAVEGGTGYWASVSQYRWDGLPARDVFAVLHEEGDDFSDELAPPLRLDINAVAKGIGKITRGEVEVGEFGSEYNRPLGDYARKLIAEASRENDAGNIDSDMADIIAQVALLGIVRYG